MRFTTEMILEDLASFAEMSRQDWVMRLHADGGGYTFHFRTAHAVVTRTRPEGLKEDVSGVLDERPAWTMSELCQRLSLPYDPPTRSSVGRVLSELNVKCIRGSRDVRVYGRGGNNQVSAKLALEVAQTAERWTTSELLGVLGWPVNKSTQVQLGRVLAQGGWIRSRNPVASNRVAVYKKTLAPVQASS